MQEFGDRKALYGVTRPNNVDGPIKIRLRANPSTKETFIWTPSRVWLSQEGRHLAGQLRFHGEHHAVPNWPAPALFSLPARNREGKVRE
jgi:hypothetical protein